MRKQHGEPTPRLSLADLAAGAQTLLLPALAVGLLVLAGRFFHENPDGPAAALGAIPRRAWVWACIAYLALILPRRPLTLTLPGLAPLAKAAISSIAGACFLLELRFHERLEPAMGMALTALVAAGCAVAAGLVLRAERAQQFGAEQARDRLLHQLILEYEKLNQGAPDPALSHPALFAAVGRQIQSGSTVRVSIWFLRPHPALDYRRPIDVLGEPGGEARLLQACRAGPNF